MTNAQHLQWIFDRMLFKHGESANYDYMRRFGDIIDEMRESEEEPEDEEACEPGEYDSEKLTAADLDIPGRIGQ